MKSLLSVRRLLATAIGIKLTALCLLLSVTTFSQAQTTSELRFKYVERNLGMDKPAFDKLSSTLKAYIKAMKEAGDIYDDVRDDYKTQIKNGKLTDKQAAELNKAKLASDAKQLEVKRTFYTKFKALTTERYIYKIFKLASDKKSKFVPTKKKSDDDDD